MMRALLGIFALVPVTPVLAQSEDLIGREIETVVGESPFEWGPFHLTPAFSIGGGYDSDAVLIGDSPNEDVNFSVAPAVRAAVPVGDRAVLQAYERLDFVHYRELQELSDVFNATGAGVAVGSSRVLLRVEGEFRAEKVRPTREIEVPIDQRTNRSSASVAFSLGFRHELGLAVSRYRVQVKDLGQTLRQLPFESLLDRRENSYAATFTRHLSVDTALFFEGRFETQDYDDPGVGRNARGFGGSAGISFSPFGNVHGQARVGYQRLAPDEIDQVGFDGLVAAADLTVPFGERIAWQVVGARQVEPSVLNESLYVVENVYGAFLSVQVFDFLIVRPGFAAGTNEYPGRVEEPSLEGPSLIIQGFETYSLDLRFRLTSSWTFRVGGSYTVRDVASSSNDRNRSLLSVGLSTDF